MKIKKLTIIFTGVFLQACGDSGSLDHAQKSGFLDLVGKYESTRRVEAQCMTGETRNVPEQSVTFLSDRSICSYYSCSDMVSCATMGASFEDMLATIGTNCVVSSNKLEINCNEITFIKVN